MNPTTHVLESRVAQLEGGHPLSAVAVASGTSAVFYAIINLAQAGDNIVASSKLYGGTYTQFNDILPTFGITVKFVDAEDPENFREAVDDKTRAFFCETVSNPALEIVDLEAVSTIAHSFNLPLIVDSTFSTPYLTKPFEHGADIIVSSPSGSASRHRHRRHRHRQGRLQLPPAVTPCSTPRTPTVVSGGRPTSLVSRPWRTSCSLTVPLRNLGAAISPDNSWIFLQGIETLSLRMERQRELHEGCGTPHEDPKVAWVRPWPEERSSVPRTSST